MEGQQCVPLSRGRSSLLDIKCAGLPSPKRPATEHCQRNDISAARDVTRILQYSGLLTISPGEEGVEQITKQGYNVIAFTFVRDLHDSLCATEELAVLGPRLSTSHLTGLLGLPSFLLSVSALSPAGQSQPALPPPSSDSSDPYPVYRQQS